MRTRNLLYLMLLGIASSCTTSEVEIMSSPENGLGLSNKSLYRTTFSTGLTGYSVSIFYKTGDRFLFRETLTNNWSPEGHLTTQLPLGQYRFLFAYNYGGNTRLAPSPATKTTSFEEIYFTVHPDGTSANTVLEGDELFLQDAHADSTYQITTASNITCQLKRAVSQIVLHVKRGKKIAENHYEPVPYETGSDIRKQLQEVQIDITNVGQKVNALSTPSGSGNLSVTLDESNIDSLSTEGFASFSSPYFFPAANNENLQVNITLVPRAGVAQPTLSLKTQGAPQRNEQLVITAWITSDWKYVGLTAETTPIQNTIPGKEGIWDDIIEIK